MNDGDVTFDPEIQRKLNEFFQGDVFLRRCNIEVVAGVLTIHLSIDIEVKPPVGQAIVRGCVAEIGEVQE